MAKQVITKLLDDMDGQEADETVYFALDGYAYSIDVTSKHAQELRAAMAPFQDAGTRLGRADGQPQIRSYRSMNTPNVAATRQANQKVRVWATQNGYDLSERGRIPQHIMEAYETGTPHPSKVAADALERETAAAAAKQAQAPARKRAASKATAASFQAN